jgi:hypothetical protein
MRAAGRIAAVCAATSAFLVGGATAAAAVTATPTSGLHDGQLVRVDDTGWLPGQKVAICEIATVISDAVECIGTATADAGGSISTQVHVIRRLTNTDCADPQEYCYVGVVSFPPNVVVHAGPQLQFAPK